MGTIEVIEPGMLTTVQDLGRVGYARLGVPVGGAADGVSLRVCNRLVGNAHDEAGLEMTLTGVRICFDHDAEIALSDAVANAAISRSSQQPYHISPLTVQMIREGDVLATGPMTGSARGYLCVRGGILVPSALGGASTHLGSGFGGFQGRSLRRGDRLVFGDSAGKQATHIADRSAIDQQWGGGGAHRTLVAVDGAHRSSFSDDAAAAFWASTFTVGQHSNRVGVRLLGPSIVSQWAGSMMSEAMAPGAVQIPENGQPIILGVDHPTTGGYPVIACVSSADMYMLGRARPGDTIRFRRATLDEARERWDDLQRRLGLPFLGVT